MWVQMMEVTTKLEWALQEKAGSLKGTLATIYLPECPAIAEQQIALTILSSQTQLLASTPGHLPRNTKPQLLASPNDLSELTAGSSAGLKTEMARIWGRGGLRSPRSRSLGVLG